MEPIRVSQPTATALIGDLMRLLLRNGEPHHSDTAALLRRIEDGVRVYEREFRAFLNGQATRLPVEIETALRAAFGELAEQPKCRCDLGFRLDALETRFHVAERLLLQRLARRERRAPPRLQHAS